MNDDSRKRLTGYLGDCWHELIRYKPGSIFKKCKMCGLGGDPENRSFTTWSDLGALVEKIVEKGDWEEFEDYAYKIWDKVPTEHSFTKWFILPPTRFCELVDKWLEGK